MSNYQREIGKLCSLRAWLQKHKELDLLIAMLQPLDLIGCQDTVSTFYSVDSIGHRCGGLSIQVDEV